MVRGRIFALTSLVALVGLTLACSGDPLNPANPSSTTGATGTNAAADGSTLKVAPLELVSPINGVKPAFGLEMVVKNAVPTFPTSGPVSFSYRFEIFDANNNKVYESPLVPGGSNGTTGHSPSASLNVDQRYSWWARAEFQGAAGPWPANKAQFIANLATGYIRANEIYDPLTDGTTVGRIHGHVTFLPGEGVRFEDDESYIEYTLPSPLTGGEMSAFITNLAVISPNDDPKSRVLSMRQGTSAFNDNPYRMSVEKRGSGAVAYRFITGNLNAGAFIESGPSDRPQLPFQAHVLYFWRVTWGGGVFNYSVNEDTTTGKLFYNLGGKSYNGTYAPNPHNLYLGSPWAPGDRGEPLTAPKMIVKQLWVSASPRPGFANR